MTQRSRNFLFTGPFSNGKRPNENDFNDAWDSFLNYQDDPISLDGNSNYVFANAIQVGNTLLGNNPGMIRFNGTNFEFRESAGWVTIGGGGGGGAFQTVGASTNVAYSGGNVGINTGATITSFLFDVNLGANAGEGNRARFGSAVIHGRSNSGNVAYFSHQTFADDSNFALTQTQLGDVTLNASTGRTLRLRIGNNTNSEVTLNSSGDFEISGSAFKPTAGGWLAGSDERIKKKIRPFKDGLDILKKIDPIRFEYNGKALTKNGLESIGVSADKLQKIAPYMISKRKMKLNPKDEKDSDILVYDGSAMKYILINAIKELSEKIEKLEEKLNS